MTTQTQQTETISQPRRLSVPAQAVMAMLFGVFLVGTAGFSHMEVLHNAAHDTRHSNGFPCH
jgi:cobalt transporter subunit CbtB